MYKPVIDKIISQRADEFAQREYMLDSYERDALSKGYYWGYKDAEKDIALAWQDIAKIDDMLREVQNCIDTSYLPTMGREDYYTEVLKRFNEIRWK